MDLPTGWTKHLAPTGHYFYYNEKTRESTYEKPVEAKKSVNSKKRPRRGDGGAGDRPKLKIELEKPWVLVFCKSGKRFVHNTETKESVWEGPKSVMEQVEQQDKYKMIELIAKARGLKLDTRIDKSEERDLGPVEPKPLNSGSQVKPQEGSQVVQETKQNTIVDYSSSEQDQAESDDQASSSDPESDNLDPEEQSEDQEGSDDDDDRESDEELSEEQKQQQFHDMLTKLQADPFGTWDTQVDRFINDERYDLYETNKERRDQFDQWSAAAIAARKQENSHHQSTSKKQTPTEEFIEFIEKSYNPKKHQFYLDFKRKLRKERGFSDSKLSDREKEALFRDYVKKKKAAGQK